MIKVEDDDDCIEEAKGIKGELIERDLKIGGDLFKEREEGKA